MRRTKTRSSNWKEQRRFHAIDLKRQGWKQADIAVALKVSKGAVSQWVSHGQEAGQRDSNFSSTPGTAV